MTVKQLSNGNPDGTIFGQSDSDKISFHGVTPVSRPVVAGATGIAALDGVLGVLNTKGLIDYTAP